MKKFEENYSYDKFSNFSDNEQININELITLMNDKNYINKNYFLYNTINSLANHTDGSNTITPDNLFLFIDKQLNNDNEVKNYFQIFSDNSKKIKINKFPDVLKELRDYKNENKLRELIRLSNMEGKEINFNEFRDIFYAKTNNKKKFG